MKKLILVSLLLAGCGGNDFQGLFGEQPDADPITSGGSEGVIRETGGATMLSAGGAREEDAGEVGAGGSASGGAGGAGGTVGSGGSGGCTLVTHYNGLGQTWEDCVPLGTWNLHEAAQACIAYTGNPNLCFYGPGCGDAKFVVQGTDSNEYNFIWGFEGNTAGFVGINGGCPSDATGKEWR